MNYMFYVGTGGGQIGWFWWRNTISSSIMPEWMLRYHKALWGSVGMREPFTPEQLSAMEELANMADY